MFLPPVRALRPRHPWARPHPPHALQATGGGPLPGELVHPPGRLGTPCASRPREQGSVLALVPPGALDVRRIHQEGPALGELRATPPRGKTAEGQPVRSPSGVRVHRASLLWLWPHAACSVRSMCPNPCDRCPCCGLCGLFPVFCHTCPVIAKGLAARGALLCRF